GAFRLDRLRQRVDEELHPAAVASRTGEPELDLARAVILADADLGAAVVQAPDLDAGIASLEIAGQVLARELDRRGRPALEAARLDRRQVRLGGHRDLAGRRIVDLEAAVEPADHD